MIILSNAVVAANAAQGSVIGSFAVAGGHAGAQVTVESQTAPANYFLISANNLLVAWAGQALPGEYQIKVHAPGGPPQSFTVSVTPAIFVTLTLPDNGLVVQDDSALSVTVPANAPAGTLLMAPPVREDANGNPIAGTSISYALGSSAKLFSVGSDFSLFTAWSGAATPGSYPIVITAKSPDGTSEQVQYTIVIV